MQKTRWKYGFYNLVGQCVKNARLYAKRAKIPRGEKHAIIENGAYFFLNTRHNSAWRVILKIFTRKKSYTWLPWVMGIYLVKNVINGVNLVKIGHFCENGKNGVIFGSKNDVIGQNLGKVVKKFCLKVYKNYFSMIYGA